MLPSNQKICILMLALITAFSGTRLGYAGSLATTTRALNDGFGPDAGRWHGSVALAGVAPFGTNVVGAIVDWAAFAPGKFALYLADEGIAGPDPSGGTDVVYAYQVVNVVAAIPGIASVTVGKDVADALGAVQAPSFVPANGGSEVAPSGGGNTGTSMAWQFGGNAVNVGETTGLLVFNSPFAPEFDHLTVASGLAGATVLNSVASPSDRLFQFDIPEPASLAMGLMSCFGLLLRSRRTR